MDSIKLTAIIVDDEPSAIRILKNFCARSEQVEVVQTFRSALNVQSYLLDQPVDLLFLDINMPALSGLELLKIIKNPPLVILTTAYSEYAVESYDFSVVDYLLKPIAFSRFIQSIHKSKRLLQNKVGIGEESEKIVLKDGTALYYISKSDVTHIQAYGNYLKVFTTNQRIVIKSSLKAFLSRYDALGLYQVHKSFAVNCKKINKISYDKIYILSHTIPIGRKYKEGFLSFIKDNQSFINKSD